MVNRGKQLQTELQAGRRGCIDVPCSVSSLQFSAADVIYKSVLVLVQFSNAGVSSDDLGRFFVNIIGAIGEFHPFARLQE